MRSEDLVADRTVPTDAAAQINEQLRRMHEAGRTALEHAATAGQMLLQVKERLPHGRFMPWLEANVACSHETARTAMKLARAKFQARLEFDAGTSIRAALRQIAAPPSSDASKKKPPRAITGEGEDIPPATTSHPDDDEDRHSSDAPAAVADDEITAPQTAEVDPADEELATADSNLSREVVAEVALEAITATLPQVQVRAKADQQTSPEARVAGAFAALKSAVEDAPAMPERERDAIRFLSTLADAFDHASALDPEYVGAVSEQSLRSDSEQEIEERFDQMIGEARALGPFLQKAKDAAIGAWRDATGDGEDLGVGKDALASGEDPATGPAARDTDPSAHAERAEAGEPEGELSQRQRTSSSATGLPSDRSDTVRPELDLFVRDFHERYGSPIPAELAGELRDASAKQLDRIQQYLKAFVTADRDPLRVLGNAVERCA